MQGIRQAFVMLILLLMTSLAPLISESPQTQLTVVENVEFTSDTLESPNPSSRWNEIQSVGFTEVEFQQASGILRLHLGEFDPLIDEGPFVEYAFQNSQDHLRTGLAIIQLHRNDGTILESLEKDYSITPLDFLSDEGWFCLLYTSPSPRDRG